MGFPPAGPAFVREEVEADVRVRAVVGEGDQVPAGVNHHHQLVPLGAVPDRQLDLAQREVSGPGAAAQTQRRRQKRNPRGRSGARFFPVTSAAAEASAAAPAPRKGWRCPMRCWALVLWPRPDTAASHNWPDWRCSSRSPPSCHRHSPRLFQSRHFRRETRRAPRSLSVGPAGPEAALRRCQGPQVLQRGASGCQRRQRAWGSGGRNSECSLEKKEPLMAKTSRSHSTTPEVREREEHKEEPAQEVRQL